MFMWKALRRLKTLQITKDMSTKSQENQNTIEGQIVEFVESTECVIPLLCDLMKRKQELAENRAFGYRSLVQLIRQCNDLGRNLSAQETLVGYLLNAEKFRFSDKHFNENISGASYEAKENVRKAYFSLFDLLLPIFDNPNTPPSLKLNALSTCCQLYTPDDFADLSSRNILTVIGSFLQSSRGLSLDDPNAVDNLDPESQVIESAKEAKFRDALAQVSWTAFRMLTIVALGDVKESKSSSLEPLNNPAKRKSQAFREKVFELLMSELESTINFHTSNILPSSSNLQKDSIPSSDKAQIVLPGSHILQIEGMACPCYLNSSSTSLTISLWINLDKFLPSNRVILLKGNVESTEICPAIFIDSTGKISATVSSTTILSQSKVELRTWTHIAIVIQHNQPTSSSETCEASYNITLFIQGKQDAQVSHEETLNTINWCPFYIGKLPQHISPNEDPWLPASGVVAHVTAWSLPLSEGDILSLAQSTTLAHFHPSDSSASATARRLHLLLILLACVESSKISNLRYFSQPRCINSLFNLLQYGTLRERILSCRALRHLLPMQEPESISSLSNLGGKNVLDWFLDCSGVWYLDSTPINVDQPERQTYHSGEMALTLSIESTHLLRTLLSSHKWQTVIIDAVGAAIFRLPEIVNALTQGNHDDLNTYKKSIAALAILGGEPIVIRQGARVMIDKLTDEEVEALRSDVEEGEEIPQGSTGTVLELLDGNKKAVVVFDAQAQSITLNTSSLLAIPEVVTILPDDFVLDSTALDAICTLFRAETRGVCESMLIHRLQSVTACALSSILQSNIESQGISISMLQTLLNGSNILPALIGLGTKVVVYIY